MKITLVESIKEKNGAAVLSNINESLKRKTLEALVEVRKQVAAETFALDKSFSEQE